MYIYVYIYYIYIYKKGGTRFPQIWKNNSLLLCYFGNAAILFGLCVIPCLIFSMKSVCCDCFFSWRAWIWKIFYFLNWTISGLKCSIQPIAFFKHKNRAPSPFSNTCIRPHRIFQAQESNSIAFFKHTKSSYKATNCCFEFASSKYKLRHVAMLRMLQITKVLNWKHFEKLCAIVASIFPCTQIIE